METKRTERKNLRLKIDATNTLYVSEEHNGRVTMEADGGHNDNIGKLVMTRDDLININLEISRFLMDK